MLDAWTVISAAWKYVRRLSEEEKARQKRASDLVSDVYNNAAYVEKTFYALRDGALPLGQTELHKALHSLAVSMRYARMDGYIQHRIDVGVKYQKEQGKTAQRYGIPARASQVWSVLREKDLAFDLVIISNSADWIASVFNLPNAGGGTQISQFPPHGMRDARRKMMIEWLRAHGVDSPRLYDS